QHVGDDLRGDRHARRARPAILPGISKIRDARGDAAGGRAFERIHHHHDLHQVVVGGDARRLQDEHVAPADVLEELDHHFAIGELADDTAPEADVEMMAYGFREARIRVAGEHAHALEGHPRSVPLERMAGEEGFEPSNAGIKIRCLNQLGDSPAGKTVREPRVTRTLHNSEPVAWDHAKAASGCRDSVRATNARMPGGVARTASRANLPDANDANTALPDPVIRAWRECLRNSAKAVAISGWRAAATSCRSFRP